MFYAMLINLMCSGFQCEVSIDQQWQATSFSEVKQQCEQEEKKNENTSCVFYYEELE